MDIQRVSYEIHHNSEDYFFPLTLETKIDGEPVTTESFQTMKEILQKMQEQDVVFGELAEEVDIEDRHI